MKTFWIYFNRLFLPVLLLLLGVIMLMKGANIEEKQTGLYTIGGASLVVFSIFWVVISFNILNAKYATFIGVGLLLVAIGLGYGNIISVGNQLEYDAKVDQREKELREKLLTIRDAQLLFRGRYGAYQANLDSLTYFIKYDSVFGLKSTGDIRDSIQVAQGLAKVDTFWVMVQDTLVTRFNIDSLKYVPHNPESATFFSNATVLYDDDSRGTPVFEVFTTNMHFMGDLYEQYYKPVNFDDTVKVGSMIEPTTNGNWN